MRRISVKCWLTGLVSALVIFSSQLPVAGAGSGKAVTWDYAPNAPGSKGSSYVIFTKAAFADIIKKDTDGRLKLIVHENLIPGPKVIDAVRDGTVNMGLQIILFRAEMALLNFVALPFVPHGKLSDMRADLRPILRKQMEEVHDVIMLGYGYWAKQRLITKTPIRTFEDLKGYKIRVHNKELHGMLKAAGANPIFLPMAEVYPALQRGVVDGAVSSLEGMYGNKFHEVVKHVSNWPLGNGTYVWVVNKPSWKKIPVDLQNTLLKRFEDKYEMATYGGGLVDDERQQRLMAKAGVTFFDPAPSDMKKYLANAPVVLKGWKKRAGPRAGAVMAVVNKVLGTNY